LITWFDIKGGASICDKIQEKMEIAKNKYTAEKIKFINRFPAGNFRLFKR
jgi:hypothetical protein